jgi:dolichyl-phosphate beta-glucosyltransferase
VTSPGLDISLVLPAYNEERAIPGTLEAARTYFDDRGLRFEIVVAADGDDGTRDIVRAVSERDPRVRVIGGAERRGKGRGIREAVAIAGGAVIGFADADGKTPIEELDSFRSRLDEGYDVVIGSRILPGSHVEVAQPLHRRLGSKGFNSVRGALLGLRDIPDSQCGFKFFRGAVARDLFSRQRVDGYMFDAEVLYLARLSGYRIAQVPIRWRDDADSRTALLTSNARSLLDLIRIRLGGRRRGREVHAAAASDPE